MANEDTLKELGITSEQVDLWKKTHGRVELAKVGGKQFIYRPLLRSELRTLRQVQGADELVTEEKIASRCVLVPKLEELQLREMGAGLATVLAQLIYNLSDYEPDSAPVKL